MAKITDYIKSSYAEAKKVSWPTKKQTFNYSVLVIGLSVGFAFFYVAVDYIFNLGIERLITR